MGRADPPYLVVGHLNKCHGTKGELFAWPLTDHPESTYAPGVVLHLGDEEGDVPSPHLPPVEIQAVRPFRRGFLVKFVGVDDRSAAEHLRGHYLLRPFDEIEELAEGEVFYHQLLGMRVRTVEGREVGKVVEVYELKPADLLEVHGPDGVALIPFLPHVVKSVDPEAGEIVLDPPEGLLNDREGT